jgi:hypothetical protein
LILIECSKLKVRKMDLPCCVVVCVLWRYGIDWFRVAPKGAVEVQWRLV